MSEKPNVRIDRSGKSMLEFVNRICDDVGPRLSGSEQEKKAGDIIYKELSSHCDSVEREHFICHPGGFLDFIWITALFYYAGVLSFYLIPILAPILMICGLLIYSLQQNFLFEIVDFLFPEIESFHVIGKTKPVKEAKNLVLISGHHDSAYEFPIFSKLGEKSSYLIIGAVINVVLNIILALLNLVNLDSNFSNILNLMQLILFITGVILITTIAIFLRSNKVVMGANDNLSAVAVVLECAKYFKTTPLKNTEVWFVSFAGEEHMRGSKRFVTANKDELISRDAILFNLETLSADRYLLATKEIMFLATHSQSVVKWVYKAAVEVNVDVEVGPLPFAGSDAANFSRKGIRATTLFGLTATGTPPNWHTLEDTPDKLSGSKIAKGAEIVVQFLENLDKE